MELKVKEITFPEVIEFNFSELKQEISERMAAYTGLVYAEEQIKDAKKDVAMLRKFTKALSDERIRLKKDLMKPYEEFEGKIKELTGIVDNAISEIDCQIKSYEDKQKQDKLEKIKEYWGEQTQPSFLTFNQIFDEKWLNASVSMKSIQEAISNRCGQIANDLDTLQNLPEFGFEATEVYKTTLDLNLAVNEGRRLSDIAKKKAEQEAEKARLAAEETPHPTSPIGQTIASIEKQAFENCMNPPVEEAPEKQWVRFQAFVTVEQAKELKQFFDSRNIEFKAV